MTPIIIVTSSELGKSLVEYAYDKIECKESDKGDVFYVDYSYSTNPSEFTFAFESELYKAYITTEAEEEDIAKTIIVFSDMVSKHTDYIKNIMRTRPNHNIVFIPTISCPIFVDIFYKRSMYKYLKYDQIKQIVDFFNTSISLFGIITNEDTKGEV